MLSMQSKQWRGSASTPVGTLHFAADDSTVISASFIAPEDSSLPVRKKTDIHQAIARYFDGELSAFDVLDVHQDGTEFVDSVYAHMRAIPPGQVATYGQLAARSGYPGAARAVGTACARNQIVLFVPCHRVVASNGLGGYGPGAEIKKYLLAHEGLEY